MRRSAAAASTGASSCSAVVDDADQYAASTSGARRPRSPTAMPCSRAHWRITAVDVPDLIHQVCLMHARWTNGPHCRQAAVLRAPIAYGRPGTSSQRQMLAVPSALKSVVVGGASATDATSCRPSGRSPVRGLLDRTWFLGVDSVLRRDRLVARTWAHGRGTAAPPAPGPPAPTTATQTTRPPATAPSTSCGSSRDVNAPNQTAATPIRPLRVTRPASSCSDKPSVPTGRRGSTMCRDSAVASHTVISTSGGTS